VTTTRAAALGLAALMVAGCAGIVNSSPAAPASGAAAASAALPLGSQPVELDPAEFSTDITNPFWPMKPGTRWTYDEVDPEGTVNRVVVTVSSETREIANGVTARIVRDTVTEDGDLIEDTLDWYAQDSAGNVWYLGEETAEFEAGEVSATAGSFEAGVDGAQPGIIMPADPSDGIQYRQEYYAGEAEDNGEVLSTDEQAEVALGHFTGCLLTKDTVATEPNVLEYKLYAPDVGPVLALGVSGGGGREELVSMETVSAEVAAAAGTVPLGEPYE
jgi:hypothetical protein